MTAADHANTVREALKAARYDHAPAYHVAMDALDALQTQAETAEAGVNAEEQVAELSARLEAAEAERDHAQNALRTIERMAGAAGSGETPAMPIAAIARAALGDKP